MYRPTDAQIAEGLDLLRRVTTKYPTIKSEGVEKVMDWLAVNAPSPDMIDAKSDLQRRIQGGESVRCPCCDQVNKVYKRTIHAAMVVQLIRLYRATANHSSGWVPVGEIYGSGGSGDYAKLRFWGIIEASDHRTVTENSSGLWRITPLGEDFVLNRTPVPKHVYVHNNEKIGEDDTTLVTARDALRGRFDYATLMVENAGQPWRT